AKYTHFTQKRLRMKWFEQQNIAEYLGARAEKHRLPNHYRNIAVQLSGTEGIPNGYPRASSKSEYGNQPWFAARCAIDGKTDNRGHGRDFPSWRPDRRDDVWWKVEFGREVQVDKLVVYLRAEFPHDKHWRSAVLEFSDGSRQEINFAKTAAPQSFTFDHRTVTWVKLTDLVQEEPLGWCALTEIEVWGRDAHVPHLATVRVEPSQRD
ncbi:unnamed protein product, partial [marine sediment metagenome]